MEVQSHLLDPLYSTDPTPILECYPPVRYTKGEFHNDTLILQKVLTSCLVGSTWSSLYRHSLLTLSTVAGDTPVILEVFLMG